MQEPPDGESGWLADYIFRGDDFQPGVAMFADEDGVHHTLFERAG